MIATVVTTASLMAEIWPPALAVLSLIAALVVIAHLTS